MTTTEQNVLLTRDEVLGLLRCCRATLYVAMDKHSFPRPIKVASTNRWLKHEVDRWLAEQAETRDETHAA